MPLARISRIHTRRAALSGNARFVTVDAGTGTANSSLCLVYGTLPLKTVILQVYAVKFHHLYRKSVYQRLKEARLD